LVSPFKSPTCLKKKMKRFASLILGNIFWVADAQNHLVLMIETLQLLYLRNLGHVLMLDSAKLIQGFGR
jgi:hypothetical protein